MGMVYFKVYRWVCWVLSAYLAISVFNIVSGPSGNKFPVFVIFAALLALVVWSGLRTRKY